MIRNNKPLVWSFSFLNTYDNCPKKADATYISKEIKYEESPEAAHGNKIHKIAEDALRLEQFPSVPYDGMNKFFHDMYAMPKRNPIEPELKLGVTRNWQSTGFFANDVWGRGKVDAPIILSKTHAIIFDWKTGKVREDPYELEVQAVLLKAAYPTLEIVKGAYIWLKEDKYGEVHDLSNFDRTKNRIERTMEKVGQGQFYVTPNPLCGWCPLKTCKHWKDRSVGK
jgi:hypothetical protein